MQPPPSKSIPILTKPGLRYHLRPKRLVLLGVFLCGLAVLQYLYLHNYLTPEQVFRFIREHQVGAPALFLVFYMLSMTFLIPTLPLNIGAGILWGPWWGSILATLGSLGGAIAAFLISRTALGQPLAERFNNRCLLWLQTELDTQGWKVVAFTRLNPFFPTGPLNFVFGLTSISITTYVWATAVFLYPPALAFAAIGYSSGQFLSQGWAADLWRAILFVFRG